MKLTLRKKGEALSYSAKFYCVERDLNLQLIADTKGNSIAHFVAQNNVI